MQREIVNPVISVQVRNPFPGLRPFREDEEHLFFGRESQIYTMIDKVSATRFLAVVGNSGSGKSSLINCGLRPALHRGLMAKAGTCWRIAQFRPGGNALRAMARALSQDGLLFSGFDSSTLALEDIVEATLRMSKLGLSRVYNDARVPEGTNLLIVVDQFEELFRYRETASLFTKDAPQRSQEATAFVNLLLEARAQTDFPIYVALTMRSDFLGDCAEFAGLPEAISEGEYLIPRLTREERRAAIVGPVGVGGADISPVLLTRLVNDVGDNPDQLSILQHALNRIWARWQNEGQCLGVLDLSHYQAIGTMEHALDHHAEKAYGELRSERQQKICEKIFKVLTDKGTDPRGIRRPTKFGVLCRLAEASPEEAIEVLSVFRKPSRSFVMPPLPELIDEDSVIDISHESLMRIWERLIVWSDEEVQSAQLYRRLSETASLHAIEKAGLWNDPDMQSALDWKEKEQPTALWADLYGGRFDQAMSFLSESQVKRDKEQEDREQQRTRELQQAQALAAERQQHLQEQAKATARLRKWLVALIAAAACLLLVSIGAWREFRKAQDALNARNRAEQGLRDQTSAAFKAKDDADRAKDNADRAKKETEEEYWEAEHANREMQLEGLRVRDANLNAQTSMASLADDLLSYSNPQQSARWNDVKGRALLSQGNYIDAEQLFSKILESFPNDEDVRTDRGYLLLILNKPKDSLKDFQYIRENVDPGSPLNNLNLTVTNAAVGNYAAARTSLNQAIDGMRHRDTEGGGETFIPPDITRATGRATLEASGPTFLTALYYMRANLDAYAGTVPAFQEALKRADDQAESISTVTRNDAYFVAMTWAWWQMQVQCPHPEVSCKDYGAFASEAALWERAGYKDWAACYYDIFQREDERWADKKYIQLAKWVEQAKEALAPHSCQNVRQDEADLATLEVMAREAEAKKDFPQAKDLLNQAVHKATVAEKNRLLMMKANLLLAYGREESQNARIQQTKALVAKLRIAMLRAAEKREEDHLPNQKNSDGNGNSNSATIRNQITAQYKLKMVGPMADQANAEKAEQQHSDEARKEFRELEQDCTDILKTNPASATAYYYRALAEDWLNEPRETVLRDVHKSLSLDPNNIAALALLDEMAPNDASGVQYLQTNRQFIDRFYKMSPYKAATVVHEAKLAQQEKRYIEALQLVDTAISMDPSDLSYYQLRGEIQRALGFDDAQVKRNLADGYHQAAYILKLRGDSTGKVDSLQQKEWETLADLAKNNANDEIQCDSSLTTCSFTKTVQTNGEWIYSEILRVVPAGGNVKSVVEAEIDKGSKDGIVVGSQGDVWSQSSKQDDGHIRQIAKLGSSEVVSIEPHSALIRIHLDQPEGDGVVRKQDMIQLKARTPFMAARSPLWAVAKYDVTFLDSNDKILVDYDTLYAAETPALDEKLFQRMLQDIHAAAHIFAGRSELLQKGRFANQSLSRAMETTDIAEVKDFVDYVSKYPGGVFGQHFKAYELYALWVYLGTPSE